MCGVRQVSDVISGLVPVIPIDGALCLDYRDGRDRHAMTQLEKQV
jgi:hypothetical protein